MPVTEKKYPDWVQKYRIKGTTVKKKGDFKMLVCDYIVEQIDGDYAHLRRVDLPDEELKLVARALLPAEIVEGCKLHYELMQYTII